eukprot:1152823-Pelagomonas_calceolata.AAC.1
MAQIIECRSDFCLTTRRAMLLVTRPDRACHVHGCWTNACSWRGTAGFLLQGLAELTHALSPLLAGLAELPQPFCLKDKCYYPTTSSKLQHTLITADFRHDNSIPGGYSNAPFLLQLSCPRRQIWLRAAVKLHNSMFGMKSIILRCVVQADLKLQSMDDKCWTAQLIQAFQGLRSADIFQQVPALCSYLKVESAVWKDGTSVCDRWFTKFATLVNSR